MTPQEAIAKLEGKSFHRESSKGILDEEKTSPYIKEPSFKEMEISNGIDTINLGKTHGFIWIFAIVFIFGGLILLYLWRFDVVSKNFYNSGFNDGVASISPDLSLAQKDNSDKFQQINQLQRGLESVAQEKSHLEQNLKEAEESLPKVEQELQGKIRSLTQESQRKITGLKNQLGFAQKDISDKNQQLAAMQMNLNSEVQQQDKLQRDLTKIRQELKSMTMQKKQLAQLLKEKQKS